MGIYRLTTRLLHKSNRVTFRCEGESDTTKSPSHRSNRIAIIDGPSFAHHVYYRCLGGGHHAVFGADIDYTALNEALIACLKELEDVGFEM